LKVSLVGAIGHVGLYYVRHVHYFTLPRCIPRYAMHSADYAVARCLSVRPSVRPSICPSHASILPKQLNISSNIFTV